MKTSSSAPTLVLFAAISIVSLAIACGTTGTKTDNDEKFTGGERKCEEAMRSRDSGAVMTLPYAAPYDGEIAPPFNTEEYEPITENEFRAAAQNPLSTFSIDVDTASYSNVRRFIARSQAPPADSVRIEELINYFDYDYPAPGSEHPFSVTTEVSASPWSPGNRLVHIGIRGRSLDYENLRPSNLVFLVDSSGSMQSEDKLPLLKKSLGLLLGQLSSKDRVSIVAYAGSAGLVLPPTPASSRKAIMAALEGLQAGGSTAGGAGIQLAYKTAKESLISGGNNRVILCTDGDFNVGVSSTGELVRTMDEYRKTDIYLTICGFGMGNYKDGRMERISKAGNGNYFYIDGIREAEKVFVREMRANMFTIAKDVKIQVEFNPAAVKGYRLVGYENRVMANEDFNDDLKDAGELGAGHTVTALYEIIPAGSSREVRGTDPLKYQRAVPEVSSGNDELLTLKLRYKLPGEDTSRLISSSLKDERSGLASSSDNFRFSAAVAGFGMILRDSKHAGDLSLKNVITMARGAKGKDPQGDRAEFIRMVETCALLKK